MVPQVQVWINNDDPKNVNAIVKELNAGIAANKSKRFMAFAIFVTPAGKTVEPFLSAIEKETGAHDIALAYISPQSRSLNAYKVNIAPEVKNTLMFYVDKRVVVKEVNLVADEQGIATMKADIAKITK